ncbi:universal stress protein [Haloterrigena alkaliphila]|uniref:universal stress protein n=1 Tax=Haloterrigena alkaliphila TaxID=2816475 RepID=UPI001CFFE2BF|nr:universal stress protein [Haloterrigena alkaliphila]UHQ95242.1 universal stress protein [Haloterrigena alkaliphila]
MTVVLLPVGEDVDRARQVAEAVLDLPGETSELEVIVLNVFTEFDVADEGTKVSSDQFYDETDFPESMETVISLLKEGGATIRPKRAHGEPAEEIIAEANSVNADYIAISGRKRSPTGKVLFGSVTQSVLLSAETPVIVTMAE